jgi:GMP synthase-like glutamine amidotransferase
VKPIRIFRHLACEGPGYLGSFLDRHGVPWELVCIDDNMPVPASPEGASGLIFMGSTVSVNDPLDWIADELRLIDQALNDGVPIMGVCFGSQLLSKALGGEVMRGPGMEIGWHPVYRSDHPDAAVWLDGLPAEFLAFHWHADTFSVPDGASRLLHSCCYGNQAFTLGDHLGMQFHLEMTERMVQGWIEHYGSDLERDSNCIQVREALVADLADNIQQLNRAADHIYGRWLQRVWDLEQD